MTYNGCLGCVHAKTDEITAAVALGDGYREIAVAFGISTMAAHRHATLHLHPDIHALRRVAETRGRAAMVSQMARTLFPKDPVRIAIIERLRSSEVAGSSRR